MGLYLTIIIILYMLNWEAELHVFVYFDFKAILRNIPGCKLLRHKNDKLLNH